MSFFGVSCRSHGSTNVWVVCIHVCGQPAERSVAEARRLQPEEGEAPAGHVLCAECLSGGARSCRYYRLACESCVLERFGLTGGSS